MQPLRTIFLATILVATALSGCLADPQSSSVTTTSDPADPSGTNATAGSTTSATGAATGTNGTSAPAENTAPTANLSADPVNGTAPLNVTFTIDAADEDGDELTWTLDADGDGADDYNGTGAPTAVVHEFTEAGNYTAILNVTDGTDFAEANFTVMIEAAAVAGPNICHRTPTQTAGPIYVFEGDNGNWVFRETNSIPGLQVGNTHPGGAVAQTAGSYSAAWVDCVQGDQMLF